ncbi:MAG: TIGR03960 family B12-binding radical SAM protein [Oscillospiraceae bacterium]|nr:TIGR03960 family B12-binding radical SAM protein [Oscillospiraceae bacterium]
MLNPQLEACLQSVQKPGRYTGGELNSVVKDKDSIRLRYAFCFPDSYEIGMSHLGMKILYALANAREDTWCERVFAPWGDMEEQMRKRGVLLYGLESGDPIRDFDLIGFTLQYELCYTNMLNMLDLAGLPLESAERTALTPIVIAGGPCVCNAEPVHAFADIFLPGDGEEITNTLIDLLIAHKEKGSSKKEFLLAASKLPGVYVPSLYDVSYNGDGTVRAVTPQGDAPAKIKKSVVRDLDAMFFPESFVVPSVEVVHDRAVTEIFRGCIRGCRFCQAGFIYRPIREKSPETVDRQCRDICLSTGSDEISLCSLSASDYTKMEELLTRLVAWTDDEKINIALPSLRADNFPKELMEKLSGVRRSSLTFAPEAGTQRLRDAINKNVTEQEMLSTARQAFEGGWTSVKLYFMLGLPTETPEDVAGIAELAQKVVDEYYANPNKPKGKGVTVSVSVSSFVPKPFTPFQWEPQDTREQLEEKQRGLFSHIRTKKISLSCHKTQTSLLEAALARGDRRLAAVIKTAWEKGCRFDGWDELFNFGFWEEAFMEHGLSVAFYANRRRDCGEVLPWDHMDYGVSKEFLIKESKKAGENETTPHCRVKCAVCGADKLNGGECDARCKGLV